MSHPIPSSSPTTLAAQAALDALAELRAGYAHDLPDRVERMALALRAWRHAPADMVRLEGARVLAHKLHGTAGSYGFPDVGEAAGRIEDAVRTIERTPSEDHAAAWSEVWTSLREAEALALAARERAGSPASGGGRVQP